MGGWDRDRVNSPIIDRVSIYACLTDACRDFSRYTSFVCTYGSRCGGSLMLMLISCKLDIGIDDIAIATDVDIEIDDGV